MDSLDWIDFNVTHSLVPSSEESAELTSSYDASNSEVFEDNGPIRKRPKIDADKLEESDIEVQEGGGKKNTKILETEGEETEIKDKEVQSLGDDGWSDIQSSEDEQESDVHGSEEKGTSSVQDTPDKQNSEEKGSPSVQDSSEDEQEPDVHGSEEKGSSSVQDTPDKQSSEEKGSPSVQDSSEDEQEPDVHGSEEESVQDTPKKSSEEKGSSSVQDSSEDEQESDVHGSEEKSVQDTAIQSSEEKGSSSVQDSSEDEQESDIHGSEEKSVQDTPKQSSEEKGSSCVQDSSEDEQESDVHGLEEKGLSSVQDTPDKQELDIQGSEDSQEYDLQVPEKTQESEIDSDQDVDDDHGVEDLPIFQRLMNLASGEATGSLKSIVKDWLEMYIADRKTAEQQFVELILQCIGCHKPFTWSDWKTSPLSLLIVVMQKVHERTGASESFFQKNSKEYDVNFQEIFGQLIQCLQHEIFRNRNIFVCTGVQTFLFNIAVRFGNITGPLTFRIIGAHFVLNWYAAILKIISDLNKKKTNQLHRMKKMKENPKLKHAYIEHKKQIKEIVKGQDEIKILADRLAKFILYLYFWDPAVEIQLMYLKHWQTLVQHHPDLMCSPREFDCIVYHVAHPDTTIRSFALKVLLTYIKVLANEDKKAATQLYSKLRPFLSKTLFDTDNRVIFATLNIYSKVFDLWIEEDENLFSPEEINSIFVTVILKDKSISTLSGTLINKELQRKSRHDPKNYITQLISYFKKEPLFRRRIPLLVNAICVKQQNWKMLISFLMDDDLQLEQNYGLQEIVLLTELTISLVRKACTGTALLSKDPTEEIIGFEKERARMTRSFIKCIPDIIKKHRDDGEKISNLVSICHYFINVNGAMNECKAIVNSIQETLEYVRHPLGLKNCFQVLKSFSMIDDEVWASCQIFAEKIANAANDSMKTSWSKGYPQEAAHHLMLLTHTVNQFEFTWMPRLLVFLKNLAKSRIDTTLEITALYCIKATFVLLFKFEPVDELVSQKGELLDLLLAILKKQDAIDNVRVLAFISICKYHEICVKSIPIKTQNGLTEFLAYCVNEALECKSKNAETLENAVVILKRVCALPVTKDIFKSCVQNLLNFLMLAEEFPEIELFQNIIYEALTKVTEKRIGEILTYLTTYFDENIVKANNASNSLKQLKKTVQKLCSFMTPAKIQRFNQEDVFFFHHGGIIFATSDENYGCYPFLGILEKFIKLLSKEKCKEIKQFIESKTKSMDNDSAIGFVKNYHLALLQQEKRLSELEKRILVKTVRKPKIPKEKKSPRPPQLPSPSVISESSPLPHTSRKPNARHTERSLEVQDRQTTKSKVTKRKEDLQKPAEKKRKLAVHDSSTEDIEMASTSSHEQSTKSLSTSHDQTSQVPMNSSNDAGSPTLKISHEMSEVSLINTKTVENMTRFSNLTEHCTSSDAANESDSDCSL